jgi:iron uptake system component EfeO
MRRLSSRTRASLGVLALVAGASFAGCAAGTASGSPATPSGTLVAVAARDYAFDPSTVSVAPGTVTFRVENVGVEEHEFEIFRGDTVVDEIEGLVPGLTKDLTVTLEAGEYTFVCKLADHEQRGMTGTLTVAP